MITVNDLLRAKGHAIYSIGLGATVLEALEIMAKKDIGALLVMDKETVAGIFSERDFARITATLKSVNLKLPVDHFMTRDIYSVTSDETIDECMALMTKKRLRHLPVYENQQLIGLISIGDVVKNMIEDKDLLIENMEKYILGRGYGE